MSETVLLLLDNSRYLPTRRFGDHRHIPVRVTSSLARARHFVGQFGNFRAARIAFAAKPGASSASAQNSPSTRASPSAPSVVETTGMPAGERFEQLDPHSGAAADRAHKHRAGREQRLDIVHESEQIDGVGRIAQRRGAAAGRNRRPADAPAAVSRRSAAAQTGEPFERHLIRRVPETAEKQHRAGSRGPPGNG